MPIALLRRLTLSAAGLALLGTVALGTVALGTAAPLAGEETMRAALSDAQAEELGQDERWAIQECQGHLAAKRWQAGALAFRRFCDQFPESRVWMYAALGEAWCLRQEAKLNGAIERLDEVIKFDPKAPEVPEVLLLQGACWQDQGEIVRGQRCLQRIIDEFPTSSAAVPARLRLDDYLVQQATKAGKDAPAKAVPARIALLAPAFEKPVFDQRSGWTYARLSERLRDLYLGAGRFADALALAEAIVPGARRGVPDFDANGFITDLQRRVVGAALWNRDDALLAQTAASAWPDPAWRTVELGRVRADFVQGLLGDAERCKQAAKARGATPTQVVADCHAQAEAAAQQIQEQAAKIFGDARNEAGWTAVRLRFLAVWPAPAGQPLDATGALAALAVFGRDVNSNDLRRFAELGLQYGVSANSLRAAAERVPEGGDRTQALINVMEQCAYRSPVPAERAAAATEAIGLAAKMEAEDAQRANDFLALQARLKEDVLGTFDQAITDWTKLNQPPMTEFAIARCLEKAGRFKDAFLRLGGISTGYAGTNDGATALLWQGRMAFERLGDKPKAVALLRQVCDDYPDSGQYSEAHQYLQSRLEVIYTGGGGKRQK